MAMFRRFAAPVIVKIVPKVKHLQMTTRKQTGRPVNVSSTRLDAIPTEIPKRPAHIPWHGYVAAVSFLS